MARITGAQLEAFLAFGNASIAVCEVKELARRGSPAMLPTIYSPSSGMLTNSSGSSSTRGSTTPSVSWPVT